VHAIVQQNLWAAFGVVALLIPATLFGLASMGIAVLIHEGSTVLVVLNALRLLRFVGTADPQLTRLKEGALTHGPQKA
jgi:Cd2+/Zn2+-exporting ATPase